MLDAIWQSVQNKQAPNDLKYAHLGCIKIIDYMRISVWHQQAFELMVPGGYKEVNNIEQQGPTV